METMTEPTDWTRKLAQQTAARVIAWLEEDDYVDPQLGKLEFHEGWKIVFAALSQAEKKGAEKERERAVRIFQTHDCRRHGIDVSCIENIIYEMRQPNAPPSR
jgi:hypothetical protein